MQEIIDADRHEHVQFEIALRRGHAHGHVVGHHLHGDHRHRLALGRVDLSRHDGAARLVLRDEQLADAAARAGGQQAHVVGDLHQIRRERLERAVEIDQLILAGERVELVGRGDKALAGQRGNLLRDGLAERRQGVQPRADRRAAQRQLAHAFHRAANHALIPAEGGRPAADLLPQRQRGRILQVGAADFNHVGIFRAEALKRRREPVKRRQDMILRRRQRRNMHRRREGIVGALGFVHVVVGVHQLFAQQGVRARGDDLVDVHVALRAAARLPDDERKFVVEFARQNFIAGGGNRVRAARIQIAELAVGQRGRLFQHGERMDDLLRDFLRADREIFVAALGLRAPAAVRGNANLAHRVVLNAIIHVVVPPMLIWGNSRQYRICFSLYSLSKKKSSHSQKRTDTFDKIKRTTLR